MTVSTSKNEGETRSIGHLTISLHTALEQAGVSSAKEGDGQRRTLYRSGDGKRIGSFTAAEAWQWLREQGDDYKLGYRHGSDSEPPNSGGVSDREAYFDGYARGSEVRDERLASGKGYIVRPEWMTDAQVEAIWNLYKRSPDGSRDRWEFSTRVQESGVGSDRYAGISWCGMFVGIEADGYTHT
jgi:hypothetical protein